MATVDVAAHGEELAVTISDDGRGFTPGAVARGEFPRFGLTTMRERAKSIGGTLDIDSAPDQGTTVRFTMPLVAATA
jgi:signal transduction histidine kinase